MSEFAKLMREQLDEEREHIHTAILARVERIGNGTADVQPVQGGFPKLTGLPLVKQRYEYEDTGDTEGGGSSPVTKTVEGPIYEIGDTVIVVFLERARDGVGERKHALEDGLIMGVVE